MYNNTYYTYFIFPQVLSADPRNLSIAQFYIIYWYFFIIYPKFNNLFVNL